jgi:hypothetical protein
MSIVEILYYTKSTRVSVPSFELAPSAPRRPQAGVAPPPFGTKRGATHFFACGGGGGGEPIRLTGEKAWHSVYSVMSSYVMFPIKFSHFSM